MLNRSPRLLLTLLVFLAIACESEENSTDDFIEENANAPQISVEGITTEIEAFTQITVNITDDSSIVNNTLVINGEEVLKNTDKNFKFDINPFDYPTGENTFIFYSVDEDGNETKVENSFIIKKLLASIASPTLIVNGRVFMSANKMSGELITNVEVFKDFENVKLYADDNFTEQPIIITSYVMLGSDNLVFSEIKSIANIEPGTDLIKFQENARAFTENTYNPNPAYESFSFEIQEIESERIAQSFYGSNINGLGAFVDVSTGNVIEEPNGFLSNLQGRVSSNSNLNNLFLHTTNSTLDLSFERIRMEDYKYLFVNNPNNQSISYSQFLPPDKIGNIYLPNDVEGYFISVKGFKDETAFHNLTFSSMYTASLENTDNGAVEIPMINGFNLIISDMLFSINGYSSMSVSVVGEKSIEIPNWSAEKNQESIFLNGDFDLFNLFTSKTLPDGDRTVRWNYLHKKQDEVNLNIESFEFPEIIESLADANQFDLEIIKTPDIENIRLIGSTGNLKYEELLFDSQNGIPRPYNAAPVDIYTLKTILSGS
ncbi:hypothetical protein [Maribacter sp. 2304DJ31-5]|uniref:hypothetical protein n=1 Tax=Maribacter sp. 2304DJ31-5 TaxID=3386273 RepID=UPI0039BD1038